MGLTSPIAGGLTTTPGAASLYAIQNGTYDFDTLQQPCDHQQSLERYQVSPRDLRTLQLVSNPSINMRAPINGFSVVQMFIHGEPIEQNDPTYGYSFLLDPLRVQFLGSEETFYKIVFNKEVRLVRPLIEVSYITLLDFCLKCSGVGVVNDFTGSSAGSLLRIGGLVKLSQRVLKMVLTSRCSFYPQFTCPIKEYIGRKFGVTVTDADITSAIITALQNLKNIQVAQNGFQTLSPQETLRDFTNILALQDDVDPTAVHVSGTIVSYTSSNIGTLSSTPINFTIQVQP